MIDRDTQRRFFRALQDRPLDLEDPDDRALYQPLYVAGADPVARLFDTIDFSGAESTQLVAGFRGTGKSTEFSRLARLLWQDTHQDYVVIRVDFDKYLDMTSPVDITEFLLVLMGAISDALVGDRLLGPQEGATQSFWSRAAAFLNQEVAIGSVGLSAGPANLKMNLKGDRTFRARVREAMAHRLPRLVEEVHDHHRQILAALRARWTVDTQLVVILDSLEHLRGENTNLDKVHQAIEELFITHAAKIRLPETHLVMSVPAYLMLTTERVEAAYTTGALQAWPACHVRERDGRVDEPAVERMKELVRRRGEWEVFLPDVDALRELILLSGGYIRDLLNMLVEAVHRASRVVDAGTVDRIRAAIKRGYLPIYADERAVLRKIAHARDFREVTLEEREYVIRFLDSHLVLCYLDEQFWYDVHPLVRDDVLNP